MDTHGATHRLANRLQIIKHGRSQETCGLTVNLRRFGDVETHVETRMFGRVNARPHVTWPNRRFPDSRAGKCTKSELRLESRKEK